MRSHASPPSLVAAVVAVALAVGVPACGKSKPSVSIVGHAGPSLGEAAVYVRDRSGGNFDVGFTEKVGSVDLLLIAVSAPDGPMPGTRAALEALKGREIPRVAILITQRDRVTDPELYQLMRLEVRELIERYGPNDLQAYELPDEQIGTKIRGLLELPPAKVKFR